MRLSTYTLLLALFVLVSIGPEVARARSPNTPAPFAAVTPARQKRRPIGQSPQTISVRPRVAAPQPGIPVVKVSVDRNRLPLGDLVTFTLAPGNVVLNPHYAVTIFFGDGQHERVFQTHIKHLYASAGLYTYSILVKSFEPPIPPALPAVKLSATPTSVTTDKLVDFKAELSHGYPNLKFRFVFADGADTGWQDSPLTTHSYRSRGTYQAYVDIGLGEIGLVKQTGGSPRRAIEVTSESPPQPRTITVELKANRLTVPGGGEVKFLARTATSGSNIQYRFDFGDSAGSTGWQPSPRTQHVYSSAGAYQARAEVRVLTKAPAQQTATSRPLSITVRSAPAPSSRGVELFVEPRSVTPGLPVYFRAVPDSPDSKTRYRFNFGDGSSPGVWKEALEETHIYSRAGTYQAFVEIGTPSERVIASRKKTVSVIAIIPDWPTPSPVPAETTATPSSNTPTPGTGTPTPLADTPSPTSTPDATPSPGVVLSTSPSTDLTPSPSETASPVTTADSGPSDNWWKYLLLAALLLYGVYQAWKYFYAPRPTLEPHPDPGVAALGTEGGPLSINFQVELDPNVTDGDFTVDPTEGNLIKSERKSNG